MKKLLILSSLLISINCYAEYSINIPLEDINFTSNQPIETWAPTSPVITEWLNSGLPYDCSNWTPEVNSIAIGIKFTQTSNTCTQDQKRTVQNQEISSTTGAIRNTGVANEEIKQLSGAESTQEGTGTRYNYLLTVGHYLSGSVHFYGVFSPNYMNQNGAGIITYTTGSFNNYGYQGYNIDHLVDSNVDSNATLRILPVTSQHFSPIVTIEGVECKMIGPGIYNNYDASCGFNLGSKIGQVLKVDIQ